MDKREELIRKIILIKGASQHGMFGYLTPIEAAYIADFIIADRKRVVEPLVKKSKNNSSITAGESIFNKEV